MESLYYSKIWKKICLFFLEMMLMFIEEKEDEN